MSFADHVPLLEAVGLSKWYGQHHVLREVDFRVHAGESVAVIGENGAGKSTFVKILAGAIRPDKGELYLSGQPVSFGSPREALKHGIAFIPQELAYAPHLTAAENVVLGQWPSRAGITSQREMLRRAGEELKRFGLDVDLRRPMAELKLADRQLVEILKALARRARIIILDEPTAALTEAESEALFRVLKQLTDEGVGVIYISHRMDEVFRFSDRVDVLRNGALVASAPTAETDPSELIAHMLGQAAETFESTALESSDEPPTLVLSHWTLDGVSRLRDVSIDVGKREVVGVFGVRGAGADLLAEGLAGRRPEIRGEITIDGVTMPVFRSPRAAQRAGISYVPAERKKDGLILGFAIRQNLSLLILRRLARFGVVAGRAERATASTLISEFNVRCRSQHQPVGQLSGGNQQKVLLASRLANRPRVLVLNEPTRGVDIGARLEIHRRLREIAAAGTPILLVTSDVEEAVSVSDRLIILRDGVIVDELVGSRKTQGQALRGATGGAAA